MSCLKLSAMKPGASGIISALHTEEDLFHRLAGMGFRVGKLVTVVRRGKFSGPMHIRIGTTDIMLRRLDAQKIDIHPSI